MFLDDGFNSAFWGLYPSLLTEPISESTMLKHDNVQISCKGRKV